MLKPLLKALGRQPLPVALLAAAGVAGALAVARARDGANGRTAGLPLDGGASGPSALQRLRDASPPTAPKPAIAGRVRHHLDALGERAADWQDQASDWRERASERASARLDDGASALRERVREQLPSRQPASRLDELREAAASLGISEKTVALFMATFIARSASGYLRWRDERRALARAALLGSRNARAADAPLAGLGVAELRRLASEREIDGRSTMNEGELGDALGERG